MGIPIIQIPFGDNAFLKQGDTIGEILFEFDDTDDIDLVGANIKIEIYSCGTRVFTMTSGNTITIIDSKSFKINEIPADENVLPIGDSIGDIQITFADGTVYTYCNIQYTVIKEYTR